MIYTLGSLINLIESNEKILFICHSKLSGSISEKLFIYLNQRLPDKISVSGILIFDKKTRTIIKNNNKTIHYKQIHFVNYLQPISDTLMFGRTIIHLDIEFAVNVFKDHDFNNYKVLRLLSNESVEKENVQDGNIMLIDLETNGVPKKDLKYKCEKYTVKNAYDNCRMLSIGYIITDLKFNVLKTKYYLIKDTTFQNNPNAYAINKITDEERNSNGIAFEQMIKIFLDDIQDCTYLVSHGTDFDINTLLHECQLHDVDISSFNRLIILNTKEYLYKESVKLGLSDIITCNKSQAHNALFDTELCLELLKIRGLFI